MPAKFFTSAFRGKCLQSTSTSVLTQWSNIEMTHMTTVRGGASRGTGQRNGPKLTWAEMLPGSDTQWLFWTAPWRRSSETMEEKETMWHMSTYIGHWCAIFHKILWNVMENKTHNIFMKFNGKHCVISRKTLSNISHKKTQNFTWIISCEICEIPSEIFTRNIDWNIFVKWCEIL